MLGIPIVMSSFGERAATPFFVLLAAHGPLLMTLSAIGFEALDAGGEGPSTTLRRTLRGLLSNPVVMAVSAGAAYGSTGLGLYPQFDATLQLLGRAAVPCALFVLGAALSRYRVAERFALTGLMASLKLLLLPLLVWHAGGWLDLPSLERHVATLTAAMPTGINVFLFAERYRADQGVASSGVVVSTVLAVPGLALCLWLLGTPAQAVGTSAGW